jgi:hypothetical protein
MTATIILWSILLFPLVLGVIFRVGAPHLFFSLMAGELLARYFGHDVEKLAADSITTQAPERYGEIVLVIAAMVLTAFFMRGTVSKSRLMLHMLPLAITGIIMAAFLLPLLPEGLQSEISLTYVGGWILNLNRAIIGVVVVVQLISLWLFNRSEKSNKHKGE